MERKAYLNQAGTCNKLLYFIFQEPRYKFKIITQLEEFAWWKNLKKSSEIRLQFGKFAVFRVDIVT